MVDPYQAGFFCENPYAAKRVIKGRLVVILKGKLEQRGLELIPTISRAVLKDEVHELIVTDQENAGPGSKVDKIAYIGFVEITAGGVMTVGDTLTCQDKVLGRVVGFDETHLPNHLNIVLASDTRSDGVEQNLNLESEITGE
ncbi:hypothetical protein [Desulfosporosinus sp. BG]|uniref:DUF6917 domain-containing protein n=1 Tax=Desulfosporosinus sp. BG TaxID=1633135 RepID=UPI00083B5A2F|nr:hypothetical protein [Desulfosporosinus sp. BG]ODA39685.1 hypothetical protein DSBG_3542 [Desulfosporosinus sp. BG]